jgi:hypothetical protein
MTRPFPWLYLVRWKLTHAPSRICPRSRTSVRHAVPNADVFNSGESRLPPLLLQAPNQPGIESTALVALGQVPDLTMPALVIHQVPSGYPRNFRRGDEGMPVGFAPTKC